MGQTHVPANACSGHPGIFRAMNQSSFQFSLCRQAAYENNTHILRHEGHAGLAFNQAVARQLQKENAGTGQ
jgi:hypothetical protein